MTFDRLTQTVAIAFGALGLMLSVSMAENQSGPGNLPLSDIEAIASEAYDAGELEEAILFWNAAANRGSVSAMVSLAVTYQEIGNSGDMEQAEKWYRAAVEKGDVFAQISLADLLLNKVPPDTKEAMTLLRQAADADNAYARERLKAFGDGKTIN